MLQTQIQLSPVFSGHRVMPTVLPAWPLPRSPAQTQNLNVFKPVDLKQKCQQVERALHFQLQVPDLTRGRRHVQAFTENSKLKGKYHSFAVREKHQRAFSGSAGAERFAEPWALQAGAQTGRDAPCPPSPQLSVTDQGRVRQHVSKRP